jgi:hypothetical protein
MLIQYLLDSTYIVLEYTNTVIHTKGKKQCTYGGVLDFLTALQSWNSNWRKCGLWGHNILEPTTGVTFFNSGFKNDPTELFPSIVPIIAGEKRFPLPNFNLKIVRIQRGCGSWMLLDALLHCWEGSAGPRLKNVMVTSLESSWTVWQ